MKVAFNAASLRPPYSGVQVAVENTARALAHLLGPDLLLFLPHGYATSASGFCPGATVLPGPPLPGRLARVVWEQLALPGAARRQEAQVLHGPAYVLSLRWRGPAVVTVYDLLTLTHPEWCKPWNVRHFRRVLPASLHRADAVVVPSEATAAELRALGLADVGRIHVVPLGLSEDLAPAPPPQVAEVRARYGLPERYVLLLGNLEPKKNLPGALRLLSRALSDLPHQVVLAGAPGWGDPRSLRQALQEFTPGRVKLLGYVPRSTLPALYGGADLFLQLSWHEGFGLPPLEAMACGTATVVSNRGALPEVSGPGALVVDPEDPPAAAAAIAVLLADEGARRELAARGQAHAARFTWERHARGLVEIYRILSGDAG